MAGDRDLVPPRRQSRARRISAAPPNKLKAQWHELDTGHYPMLSMPDELTALLTAKG